MSCFDDKRYAIALVIWAIQYNMELWMIFITTVFLVLIILIFYILSLGIRDGMVTSKQSALLEIKSEIREIFLIYSLLYSRNIASQSEISLNSLSKVTSLLESLSKRGDNIESINEWMFFPKFELGFATISPMISVVKLILDIYLKNQQMSR